MMAGKNILSKFFMLWLFLLAGATAFAAEVPAQGPVAILLSDDEFAYQQPMEMFINEVDHSYEIYSLHGEIENASEVMTAILAQKPALIFTLGAKASYVAKIWTIDHQEIPVLFAMVLNWERFDFLKRQDNIAGIATDVDPGAQFLNMTLFFPEARKIGTIYSEEHSGWIIKNARQEAARLGLELIAEPIRHPKDFQHAFRKIVDTIDSFWFVTDPVVFTLDNIAFFEKRCIRDRLVCIGQSENIAKLGVLLAVDPDIPNIGVQAAAMAKSILAGRQRPENFGVQPPLGTRLLVNLKTAEKIGLPISDEAKNLANTVIGK